MDNSKFLGNKTISPYKWVSEKQRVADSIEKFDVLNKGVYEDYKPNVFRDRMPEKEI